MSKKHDPTEEAHNHADTVAAILKGETPEWSDLKLEFERMKYDHRLKDADIALIFGYKDAGSFRRSRAHRERVREIVWFWLKTQ